MEKTFKKGSLFQQDVQFSRFQVRDLRFIDGFDLWELWEDIQTKKDESLKRVSEDHLDAFVRSFWNTIDNQGY